MSNALSVQIGQEVISMFADFFPDLQQQLDKLTVIHYDNKSTSSESDKDNCSSPQSNEGGKVPSLR